jgi:hypothetical protein
MDAARHHITRRCVAGIKAILRQSFAEDVAVTPIGMAPMSCSCINFASSMTGVSGLTQSSALRL